MFPALVCGNACVFKPAEDVPHTGTVLVEIMLEAGLPPEVIQLVHGQGETGAAIVEHPDVPLVSFTGSTETGRVIGETCGRMHKRLSLEMGGKNAQIVLDDADLDLALEGVLWGAFGTTGQRCTATSRLILQKGIHDNFLGMLVDKARGLRLGDGRKSGTDVGPVINDASLAKIERYIDIGQAEGADLLCGGRRADGKALAKGHFFEPTIFARVEAGMRVEQEEIFGPVLSVVRVSSADEAFRSTTASRTGSRRRSTRATSTSPSGAHGARQRHHLHQRADDRRRGAPPVRRREADRQRPPRGRVGGVRVLLGDEGRLRRLLGHAAARADRQLPRHAELTVGRRRDPRPREASSTDRPSGRAAAHRRGRRCR
jgi:hypothetical protein